MSRPPDPETRARLRDDAVRYVLTHGIADLSLRPLAAALGTSARMLVYHFGSREGLMRAILEGLRAHADAQIEGWLSHGPGPRTLADFLGWYWERVSAPNARDALRIIFELYALALRRPKEYPGVLDVPLAYWAGLRKRTGVAVDDDPALVTLVLAATRGLLLDVCATGDARRTGAALELLATAVREREGERGRRMGRARRARRTRR